LRASGCGRRSPGATRHHCVGAAGDRLTAADTTRPGVPLRGAGPRAVQDVQSKTGTATLPRLNPCSADGKGDDSSAGIQAPNERRVLSWRSPFEAWTSGHDKGPTLL